VFANRPNGAIYSLTPPENSSGQGPDNVRQLTHPPFPLEDWSAVYSPEADQIVFTSDRLHPDRQGSDLFTMRADGTHLQPIKTATPNMNRSDPQWGTAPLQPTDTAPAHPSATIPSPRAVHALRRLCNAQRTLAPAAPCAVSSKSRFDDRAG